MYNEKVLNIFRKPDKAGKIVKADAVGEVGSAACGDIMKIYLRIDHKTEKILDAKFQTFGCAAAIASTNTACHMIIGKTLEDALKIKNTDVIDELGELPPQKIHCSVLAEEAIADAVADYRKKNSKK